MGKPLLHFNLELEDGAYFARCLDVDVASDGETATQAVPNLLKALAHYGGDEGWEPMRIPASEMLANVDLEWANAPTVGRDIH